MENVDVHLKLLLFFIKTTGSTMKTLLSLLTVIAVYFLIMSGCCFHSISPQEMTHSTMTEIFYRAHLYAKEHKKIPYSFDVLPKRSGSENEIIDGWDRELILKITDDKVMTLTSYGEDGKPGGSGDNSDISRSHWLKNTDGTLWIGKDLWIVRSEIKDTNNSQ